jgi:hypothetical protein
MQACRGHSRTFVMALASSFTEGQQSVIASPFLFQGLGFASDSLREWLMLQLMPVIAEGLSTISRDRPTDPIRMLAARLMQEAEKVRGQSGQPEVMCQGQELRYC